MGGGREGKDNRKWVGGNLLSGSHSTIPDHPTQIKFSRNLKKFSCLSGCLTRCEEQTLWKAGRREKCAGNDPFLPSCLPNLLCVKQPDMQARSVRFPPAFSAGSGSYDLSEIRRLGIRAEKAAWRAWGSARASRAAFRALAEYTRRPKAFRMPVDARCAARGARHGTRGARAPHARRSAFHASR